MEHGLAVHALVLYYFFLRRHLVLVEALPNRGLHRLLARMLSLVQVNSQVHFNLHVHCRIDCLVLIH